MVRSPVKNAAVGAAAASPAREAATVGLTEHPLRRPARSTTARRARAEANATGRRPHSITR